jgi:homoserine kinase
MKSGIKVVAPASVSNMACGFDVLGMALDIPSDEIIGSVSDQPGVRITSITGDKKDIPLALDPAKNIAAITASALLHATDNLNMGIDLRIKKNIPGGSGLGSSASSATAAAVLVNELLGNPFEKRALIPYAVEGEIVASGTKHGDNVVPAMLGGLMLIRDIESLDYHRIFTPKGLFVAVLLPEILIPTKSARAILRQEVPLKDVVKQTANIGALIIAMHTGDLDLISRSMQDHIIESQRKHLIPHYDEVKDKALELGALACNISGAGPAVYALCHERSLTTDIANAMQHVYDAHKIAARSYAAGINHEGTVLM